MSIKSMTGFGRFEGSSENYHLNIEVKSVNHRFRDVRFRMSNFLSREETNLKAKIEKVINRGSVDISIQYKNRGEENRFNDLDIEKIEKYVNSMQGFMNKLNLKMEVRPCDFLRSEFQKDKQDEKFSEIKSILDEIFDKALADLCANRAEEGAKLKVTISDNVKNYQNELDIIRKNSAEYKTLVEKKLKEKFQEHSSEVKIDESRFLQEVIYYLEKLDVSEELERIESHLSKLESTLNSSGPIGRQLDFVIQELNRETNTIGSKSNSSAVSNAVVNMKVFLEKVREQALNIE